MCIAANRFTGIRAAVGVEKIVCKAREHNDINVICFGARVQTIDEVLACLDCFLNVESSTQPRHRKRIDKLDIIGGL
jgi:ribose 5-phosphate isomerase B